MNDRGLVNLLAHAGFRGKALQTAFGIAKRESGGRPDAFNPDASTGDRSYGLFQINMLGGLGPARRQQFGLQRDEDLLNPLTNAKAAYRMSKGGKDFGAWGIGPNAYRSGAGYETIAKYVDQAPSLGPGRRSSPGFKLPGEIEIKDDFKIPDLNIGGPIGGGGLDLGGGLGGLDDDIDFDPPPQFGKTPSLSAAIKSGPSLPGTKFVPTHAVPPGKGIALPWNYKSTHVTDGLVSEGFTRAIDIMGSPGTPVAAPQGGTVVYFHPDGAQGGGSMLVRFDDGREGWLGHIENGLPAGARFKPGMQLADISPDHPRPHVHWSLR